MRSKLLTVGVLGIAVALLMATTSCQLSKDQVKEIARNVGLFSATTWIAIDNPNSNVLVAVTNVLLVVKEKASSVKAGETYVAVVYPEIEKIINATVEQQYRPLCKAGAVTLLGQLDLLFVAHPEWKQDQDLAIDVANSFIDGAIQGLSLAETDPIMKQLRLNFNNRSAVVSGDAGLGIKNLFQKSK